MRAYARMGVLGAVCKECLKGVLRRKSADRIYYAYQPRIVQALQEQYASTMRDRLVAYEKADLPHERADIVWFCWLQGVENAPLIVRICLDSLKRHLPDKEIRVVDESNRRQYVSFPDHIERRWKKGQIPPAQFSDLLRLELLIRHGGTWIDSTVLCTGNVNDNHNHNHNLNLNQNQNQNCLDADLFFFQFKQDKDAPFGGISNWFITSCQNHPLLMTLRDMLYAYWKDYDCVLEYFVFHRFFDMIAAERPDELSAMLYAYSPDCLALGHNWWRPFKQETWDKLVAEVAFHKLTYKVEDSVVKDKGNYYNYIMVRGYGLEVMGERLEVRGERLEVSG